jgi:signal transduction histidine kinase
LLRQLSFKAGIDKIVLLSFTLAFSCLLFFSFYTYGRLEKRLALQAENASLQRDLFYVFLITSACAGLFLIILYLIVHSSLSGKKKEQERLRLFNVDLTRQVDNKTKEIMEVFERVSDGFFSLNDSWIFTYVNSRAEQIINQPKGFLLGKNIWEYHTAATKAFYQACVDAMAKQQYQHLESIYAPSQRLFEIHIYPSLNGISIYFTDITERKDAEQKVLKASRLYATISEVNKAIVYADSPEKLFRDICHVVIESGKFRMAWIGLIDKESRMVVPVNHAGHEEGYLSMIRVSVDNIAEGMGPTGTAIREGRHYVCNDIGTDPAMETWRQEALSRNYRSSIALPIIKSGEPYGSFSLYSHEENFFDKEEIQLLDEVVQDMSFALDAFDNETSLRAKEEEIRDMNGQLRDLASNLQNIREEERTYIAREIHDELGQQLTAIKLDAAWLDRKIQEDSPVKQRIGDIISMLSNVIHSIRKIAMQLRPSVLDDLGLIEALKWQSRDFQNRYGIPIDFQYPDDPPALATASATGLFRIFQEALTNIARHAEATAITADLRVYRQQLVMTIADNGKGFDINAVKKKKTLGLLGMKERTLMMKGTYEIVSQPEEGTNLSISIPLDTYNKLT